MSSDFFYNSLLNYYKIDTKNTIKSIDDPNIQIIGYYDTEKKIWFHAWSVYNDTSEIDKYKKSKELLIYVLNIEKDLKGISSSEKTIIKSMISNAKIYISDPNTGNDKNKPYNLQIKILIAVICYLSKAKKLTVFLDDNFYNLQIYAIQV